MVTAKGVPPPPTRIPLAPLLPPAPPEVLSDVESDEASSKPEDYRYASTSEDDSDVDAEVTGWRRRGVARVDPR